MNPVFRAAAEANELGLMMGVLTILFFTFFLMWGWWAFRPGNRERMDTWSKMPLEDDTTPGGVS